MRRGALLIAVTVLFGCPQKEEDVVRFGVDGTLQELRLGEFIQASFEEETKKKTKLIYADTDELFELARTGKVDTAFIVSEDALALLQKDGVPIRAETYAHEEFIAIGPFKDYLGHHGEVAGAEFLKNVARTNYRYLLGREGSVEKARHDRLYRIGRDKGFPGSWFKTDLEGKPFTIRAIDSAAFAFVKRSSLLLAALEGKFPHRIYKQGDPEFVLRMVVVEVHPARTRRDRKPELYDFITSEKGQEIVERFGVDRFGAPVYGAGAPEEGQGAKVPALPEPKPPEGAAP